MTSIPTLAGIASTLIFAWSVLPMLAKAHRTRDLASYSLGNLPLVNVGNPVHSVYVFSLPAGPIWALHGFYLATSWLMLIWCLRYASPSLRKPPLRGVHAFGNDGHNQHILRDRLSRDALSQGDPPAGAGLSQNREGLSERWASAETCMKADQPAIAPSSTATGTRPPGLPVHHAPDASSSSVRRVAQR
jgi:hypothetical protein